MSLNTQQMAAAYSMTDKAQSHAAVHLLICDIIYSSRSWPFFLFNCLIWSWYHIFLSNSKANKLMKLKCLPAFTLSWHNLTVSTFYVSLAVNSAMLTVHLSELFLTIKLHCCFLHWKSAGHLGQAAIDLCFSSADLENKCRSWHWQSIMPPDRQQLVTQESFDGNSWVCNSKSASAVESQLHSRATCHFLLQYHCWFWAGLVYWFVSLSHFISWWLLCWPWTGYLGFFAFSLNANRSCTVLSTKL